MENFQHEEPAEQQIPPIERLLKIIKEVPDGKEEWRFVDTFRNFSVEVLRSVKGYRQRKYLGYDKGGFFYELEKPPYDHYCVIVVYKREEHITTREVKTFLQIVKEIDSVLILRPIIIANTGFYKEAADYAKSEGCQSIGSTRLEALTEIWYQQHQNDDSLVCEWIKRFGLEKPVEEQKNVSPPLVQYVESEEAVQARENVEKAKIAMFMVVVFSALIALCGWWLLAVIGAGIAVQIKSFIAENEQKMGEKVAFRQEHQEKEEVTVKPPSREEQKYKEDMQKKPAFAITNNAPRQIPAKIGSLTSHYSSKEAGNRFEEIICVVLRGNGFQGVYQTTKSGDYGVDVIGYKGGRCYAFQCKCYQGAVSNHAVQEVYSGKAYYKCNCAVVITNSTFSTNAVRTARATGVALWDCRELSAMLSNLDESEFKKIMQILQ